MTRSPLFHGLRLTLRHPSPLVWSYAFSFVIAWLTSLGLRTQYSNVTSTSLAAQRLIGGFDLGVALDAARRLSDGPAGSLTPSFLTIPLYLLLFIVLLPGTLLTYQTRTSLRLASLLQTGLQSFWSFIRITLLTLLVAAPVVGVLSALQGLAATRIDRSLTGRTAFLINLAGYAIIFLVAALIRLYFDLVAVYAVHLALHPRQNGRPDRRIRKTLRPALTTLRRHLLPAYLTFLLLTLAGAAGVFFLTRSGLRHLAQPRVWPTFLLAQGGIVVLIFTRLWQRAAQTILVQNDLPIDQPRPIFSQANPAPLHPLQEPMTHYASSFPTPLPDSPISPILPGPDSNPLPATPPDPIPGSEPISPSLAAPDAGVYRHQIPAKDDDLIH